MPAAVPGIDKLRVMLEGLYVPSSFCVIMLEAA